MLFKLLALDRCGIKHNNPEEKVSRLKALNTKNNIDIQARNL
jgi:hypothetical protein